MSNNSNSEEQYQVGKLVMNLMKDPDKIKLADKVNLYHIQSKKHKTKSDAVYFLITKGFEKLEDEERAITAKVAAEALKNIKQEKKEKEKLASME